MPDSSGGQFIKFITEGWSWLVFLGLAFWGGTVNYLGRIKANREPFSLVELVGEWAISGFAGVLIAFLCFEMGYSWHFTAFASGIAGHMGGRTIYMLEGVVKSKMGAKK